MNLKDIINIIRKWIWIIILLPCVAGVASAYVSYVFYSPEYESTATLMVISKDTDPKIYLTYNDILAGQQLVKEYKEIIKSRVVTKAVVEELSLPDLDWTELAGLISVNSKDGTRILEIKVKYKDSRTAALLANKVSEVFMRKVTELIKVENIQILDEAEITDIPIKAGHVKNIAIALLAGISVAVAIIFIIEELNDRLKTVEDVEDILNVKVIGVIPSLDIK